MNMKQIVKYFALLVALTIVLAACSKSSDTPPPPANNVAFITSVSGMAKLGDWAGAGGNTGLAAGNAICQARATAARLPGTYRAWISDSTTDAYCNVLGLTGTESGNCGGLSTLPVAGPWVRTDGAPFAPTIDLLTADPWIIYTPLNYDEFGHLIPDSWISNFTNTDQYGVMWSSGPYNACSDWTDGTTSGYHVVGGAAPFTDSHWATGFGYMCTDTGRLLCLQTGSGIPLPAITAPAGAKKVFVTSVTGTGNLTDTSSWPDYSGSATGAAAGDTICQARAALIVPAVADPTKFKAWLSDSGTDAIDRLTSNGPWVRLDGILVAQDKTVLTNGLISGLLFTSIVQNEYGVYWSGHAWTGTNSDGTKNADRCNDWTDDGTSFYNGESGATYIPTSSWTQDNSDSCSSVRAIYCFED